MYSETCPHCEEPAYSSAGFEDGWVCPTCAKQVYHAEAATIFANREVERLASQNERILRYRDYWLLQR